MCAILDIDCGDPGDISNGMATFNGTSFASITLLTCEVGHVLLGDSQRICQASGIWSGPVPECQR